jgi:hypothetical protein
MQPIFPSVNPLGWVLARVLGPPKTHISLGVGYPTIAFVLTMFIYRMMQPMNPTDMAYGVILIVLVLQGVLLGIVAPLAIRRAVQRDISTGMIESHRLTGITPERAILGYLTGPTIQALMLFAENILIGMVCYLWMPAGQVYGWIILNALMLCAAFVVWSATLFLTLAPIGRGNMFVLLVIAGNLAGGVLYACLPGWVVLLGVVGAVGRLDVIAAGGTPSVEIVLGVPAQLIFGAILCMAAARKYQRDDVQAFDLRLGLWFFAASTLLMAAGLWFADSMSSDWNAWAIPSQVLLPSASQIALALAALLPIAAAARANGLWQRRKCVDLLFNDAAPFHYLLVASIVSGVFVVALLPLAAGSLSEVGITPRAWIKASACLSLGVLMQAAFLRRVYGFRAQAAALGIIFFVFTWALPLLIEGAIFVYAEALEDQFDANLPSPIMSFSPVGAALRCALPLESPLWPGLGAQIVLTLFLAAKRYRVPQAKAQ